MAAGHKIPVTPAAERVVGVQLEAAIGDAAGPLAPGARLRPVQHGCHALARLPTLLLRHASPGVRTLCGYSNMLAACIYQPDTNHVLYADAYIILRLPDCDQKGHISTRELLGAAGSKLCSNKTQVWTSQTRRVLWSALKHGGSFGEECRVAPASAVWWPPTTATQQRVGYCERNARPCAASLAPRGPLRVLRARL